MIMMIEAEAKASTKMMLMLYLKQVLMLLIPGADVADPRC